MKLSDFYTLDPSKRVRAAKVSAFPGGLAPLVGGEFDVANSTADYDKPINAYGHLHMVEGWKIGTSADGSDVVTFKRLRGYASETIQILAGCAANDEVEFGGVTFAAVAGAADPAAQEFEDVATSGSAANTAASLLAALRDPATIALMAGNEFSASVLGDTVTVTAATKGARGRIPLTENTSGARIALGDSSGTLDLPEDTICTLACNVADGAVIVPGSWDDDHANFEPGDILRASATSSTDVACTIHFSLRLA